MPRVALVLILLAAIVAGCTTTVGAGAAGRVAVRLGYFPNLTHAAPIVAIDQGFYEEALGNQATLTTNTFNAGTDAIEALFSGSIDATFIGPNPAINAYARSGGKAIRIIAGATSGGAALVVRDGIDSPEDLAGATIASPSLGNTQDVALRAWLAEQGYETELEGGGDVSVLPQENGLTLDAFMNGNVDGAWAPEPWATRLVQQGGGHVLVDERDLWPDGQFVTTHLIVSTTFLEAHPDIVKALLEGHVEAIDFLNGNPEESQEIVATAIADITNAELPAGTLELAWPALTFTADPIAASLTTSAERAEGLGLLEPVDLDGIYELELLNEVLSAAGKPVIDVP
jgi:NitT/TauT family transport system substrate-binding protein